MVGLTVDFYFVEWGLRWNLYRQFFAPSFPFLNYLSAEATRERERQAERERESNRASRSRPRIERERERDLPRKKETH